MRAIVAAVADMLATAGKRRQAKRMPWRRSLAAACASASCESSCCVNPMRELAAHADADALRHAEAEAETAVEGTDSSAHAKSAASLIAVRAEP